MTMARATRLLQFHEEVEKDLTNYVKNGKDWSETPTDLTLQGTKGFIHNDQGCPDSMSGKYYPSGHRPTDLKRLAK